MKTFALFNLDESDAFHRLPLWASSWSLGTYGCVSLSSTGKLGSCIEAPSSLAWGDLSDLPSFMNDLVITLHGPRCPLAGSMLHGPKR